MGISDDIKPKKIYRYREDKPVVNPEESSGDLEIKVESTTKSVLEDEFFNENNIKKTEKNKKTKTKGYIPKFIYWLLVLAIIFVLIWKNKNRIDQLIESSPYVEQPVLDTNEDEIYQNTSETMDDSVQTETSQDVSSSTPAESSAAKPQIDRATKIEVLNGNGIKGAADVVSDLLVTFGYKVEKVANAKSFSYANTLIYYATGKESQATLIESALDDYECEKILSDSLVGNYDILVVVGKK